MLSPSTLGAVRRRLARPLALAASLVGLALAAEPARAVIWIPPGAPVTPTTGDTFVLDNATYGYQPWLGDAVMTMNFGGDLAAGTPFVDATGGINTTSLNGPANGNVSNLFVEISFDKPVVLRLEQDHATLFDETFQYSAAGHQVFYDDFAGGANNGAGTVTAPGNAVDRDFDVTFGAASGGALTFTDIVAGTYSVILPGTVIRFDYTETRLGTLRDLFRLDVIVVPEPGRAALAALALGALALRRRRGPPDARCESLGFGRVWRQRLALD